MKTFKIFIKKRSIDLSRFSNTYVSMNLGGKGSLIYYHKSEYPDGVFTEEALNIINRTLRGISTSYCIIEDVNTAEEAIDKFYEEWEGAKCGTPCIKDSFAIWIDETKEILEYPVCNKMHKNTKDYLICGEEEGDNGNGEYGMCILEGFDEPDFYCPIAKFNKDHFESSQMSLLEKIAGTSKMERRMINEFKIVKHKEI